MARFIFTKNYNSALERIEDFIFSSASSLEQVSQFLDEHDRVLTFLQQNPKTPAIHPVTGDQSWVFSDGRYRLFFRAVESSSELTIYLLHLIDNREANIDVYPGNKIPTYDEE